MAGAWAGSLRESARPGDHLGAAARAEPHPSVQGPRHGDPGPAKRRVHRTADGVQPGKRRPRLRRVAGDRSRNRTDERKGLVDTW